MRTCRAEGWWYVGGRERGRGGERQRERERERTLIDTNDIKDHGDADQEEEDEEKPVVVPADNIMHPRAVVVEALDTAVCLAIVLRALRPRHHACEAVVLPVEAPRGNQLRNVLQGRKGGDRERERCSDEGERVEMAEGIEADHQVVRRECPTRYCGRAPRLGPRTTPSHT